jgi:hypothetical protein
MLIPAGARPFSLPDHPRDEPCERCGLKVALIAAVNSRSSLRFVLQSGRVSEVSGCSKG